MLGTLCAVRNIIIIKSILLKYSPLLSILIIHTVFMTKIICCTTNTRAAVV